MEPSLGCQRAESWHDPILLRHSLMILRCVVEDRFPNDIHRTQHINHGLEILPAIEWGDDVVNVGSHAGQLIGQCGAKSTTAGFLGLFPIQSSAKYRDSTESVVNGGRARR